MKNVLKVLFLIATLPALAFSSDSFACARTPNQLSHLLSQQGFANHWQNTIQGKWSKRANGNGFNILVHNGQFVYAANVAVPVVGGRDAQYVQICAGDDEADFIISGQMLGRAQSLRIQLLEHAGVHFIELLNSPASGRFQKRNRSLDSIRLEFLDLLNLL